ncbi:MULTISPECIES: SDR family oxidoreductase [Streptomyces]|uniref:SDR family oxidoreductase n=1 Tax=Streptomyces evansiae TaxID=3075535 RepID=A0ABU2QSW1_9ACTN|nr:MULTISPECIES: SDR family oxidoreductase [unclassified Streptomyces]EFL01953.1 NmrA family protein [Streptomyces sp. SPB78]MDT0407531.1 SDR family oxidoreductase [Streptomyces sp. DSM 41979]MDT0420541.1 SDR family oxidoreductase [Streptomyces sp. DSM 41859]MYQ61032.1 NAD(P)H-binding protein [Streptomyces sp. SID4926]WEH29220.1 SDR family oxidoreductase [Streptomyces sp. AM 3-1-1]
MSIVVTGATGQLGRLVIAGLLEKVPASEIAAVVRGKEKGAEFAAKGIELRIADYNEPETLKDAFRAGDRVLFISGSEVGKRAAQHTAVVGAAKEAGVAQLAYTGVLGGPEADFALAEEHKVTERAILDAGVPYTFLRNGWYDDMYIAQLPVYLANGAVLGSSGEGRIAPAPREDYAAAAVAVLTGEGHLNQAYELSGDVAWTMSEFAAEIARQSGKPVVFSNVAPEQYQQVLLGAGLPEPMAEILTDVESAIERGLLAGTTHDLSRLIGRGTTPIADSIAAGLKKLEG